MIKRYRVTSKFRFTIFMTLMILIMVALASSLMGYNDVSGDSKAEYVKVVVSNGDTLWTIAQRYNDGSKDIRAYIDEISKLNNIESWQIYAGQEISIPI